MCGAAVTYKQGAAAKVPFKNRLMCLEGNVPLIRWRREEEGNANELLLETEWTDISSRGVAVQPGHAGAREC